MRQMTVLEKIALGGAAWFTSAQNGQSSIASPPATMNVMSATGIAGSEDSCVGPVTDPTVRTEREATRR